MIEDTNGTDAIFVVSYGSEAEIVTPPAYACNASTSSFGSLLPNDNAALLCTPMQACSMPMGPAKCMPPACACECTSLCVLSAVHSPPCVALLTVYIAERNVGLQLHGFSIYETDPRHNNVPSRVYCCALAAITAACLMTSTASKTLETCHGKGLYRPCTCLPHDFPNGRMTSTLLHQPMQPVCR